MMPVWKSSIMAPTKKQLQNIRYVKYMIFEFGELMDGHRLGWWGTFWSLQCCSPELHPELCTRILMLQVLED